MAQQAVLGHSTPNYKMENCVLGIVTNLTLTSSMGQHIINILRSSPLNVTRILEMNLKTLSITYPLSS